MICSKCQKDHTEPNDGPLTVCEREEYRAMGSYNKRNGETYRAYGTGNRIQLREILKINSKKS